MERTREIGMLRGVGMISRQVAKMILAESSVMGIIGSVFGLALGLILSRVLVMSAGTVQGYHIKYTTPVQGILFSVVLALVISQVAAIAPARRAAKLRIVEAIQFE